jgi:tripartite-type tricarboxylate transporter receptor subunit TctC
MRSAIHCLLAFVVINLVCCLSYRASGDSSDRSWPEHTVKLIVPLSVGTAVDVSARLFAEQLSQKWKQSVVVENLPGADGIVATREFVNRRDDHTLLYSFASPITINPVLYAKLPYDPTRDLSPIAIASDNFLAIAVSSLLDVHSLSDLVKLAQLRATKLNWAATAGLPYFAFTGFQKNTGIELVYVPYRDFNPALSDLGEGRIDVAVTALTQMLAYQQSKRLRFVAILNRVRSPLAPEVPTAAEAGFPDLTSDGITGFFGWRNMPEKLRSRIAGDVRTLAADPSIKRRLEAIGIRARGSTPEEFAAAIEEQRTKIAAVAAAIGAKPSQ